MQNFRGTFVNKNRDARVEINLNHLEHNILEIRNYLKKHCKKEPDILAVIKADGYGHGSVMCALTLIATGVKEFGVASVDEGIELRENKVTCPILVLGATPLWAFENAIKYDIAVSIFNEEHLEMAQQLYKRLNKKLKAHIKIDTGMNRIGISSFEAKEFISKVLACDYIDLKGVFTHFADVENDMLFKRQIEEYLEAIKPFEKEFEQKGIKRHCLNSPAIFIHPEFGFDMVRSGIIMWGLTPFSKNYNPPKEIENVLPVMGLKARITNIHIVKKGDGLSYGHAFVADKDIKVATIPIGYADGLDRKLSGKITAFINGKEIKQIGRITMDQTMFDVTNVDCQKGDVVELLSDNNKNDNIDSWANMLETINYEMTCRLKMRLPRIYVR